jgi:hypothetical protein
VGFTPPASQPLNAEPAPQAPAQPPVKEPAPVDQNYVTFAKLTPQQPLQQPAAQDIQTASSAPEEKKDGSNFPPFPVGEFLKMFPEARPE